MAEWGVDVVPEEQRVPICVKKDMVEVVRCKDCKWFENVGRAITIKDYDFYVCAVMNRYISTNDYCSYGERKDG